MNLFLVLNFLITTILYEQLSRSGSFKGILKRIFFIPSEKSPTNAILLGGLPFWFSVIMSTYYMTRFFPISGQGNVASLSSFFIATSVGVLLYGYLDDKIEIRPIAKLLMQTAMVGIFSLNASLKITPEYSSISFCVLFFLGMGLLNGTNLLDGLDTLLIKLSAASYLAFIIVALAFDSQVLLFLSLSGPVALAAFYFYNRAPAKIYLGEIGGGLIGFHFLFLSSVLFEQVSGKVGDFNAAFLAILPLALPIVELSVSFMRRLMNKKSPFKGDRFHLHHILKNNYQFPVSQTTNMMGGTHIFLQAAFTLLAVSAMSYGPMVTIVEFALYYATYLALGHKIWFPNSLRLDIKDIFNSLRKKDVIIISADSVSDFELVVLNESSFQQEESLFFVHAISSSELVGEIEKSAA